MSREMWRVVVTYGNRRNQTYAQVPSRESAEKLREVALTLNYHDARVERVVLDSYRAQHVSEEAEAPAGGGPVAPSPGGGGRPVRDMRARTETALAG